MDFHLTSYIKIILLQRVSPDNWLAKCELIFLNSSSELAHEVEQFQRIGSRSYCNGTNNEASKMPIFTRSLNHASQDSYEGKSQDRLLYELLTTCTRANIIFR